MLLYEVNFQKGSKLLQSKLPEEITLEGTTDKLRLS